MTFSRSREKTERDSFANTKNRPCHSPTAEKNRGGGGCRKRRRALKKSPRALKSNTAGFEKKAAGFGSRHGGLCDETPQASETGTLPVITESLPVTRYACVVSPEAYSLPDTACVVSPKTYPSPGAVSCTASTLHPFFATAACHHLKFPSKHLKHLGGRFTGSLLATRRCVLYGFDITSFLCNSHLSPSSFCSEAS
ncbi:hypothetical protein IX324_002317 [Bacteroides pyogenes]|nr:hypothetical protein [Bacteroides pyogenes]